MLNPVPAVSPFRPNQGFAVRAARAAACAEIHADAVDAQGRFPQEAIDALRRENLLGIFVPAALGGESATMSAMVDICYTLGRACSSTGMIYAMHQVHAACIVRHGMDNVWHQDFLRRLAAGQWLLASSTTEGAGGGNVRVSEAPVEYAGGRILLARDSSVISYGAQADAIVTTARRNAQAAASDQVLVVFEKRDCALERTGGWDTLGMRGTCSAGFALKAVGEAAQILPVAYGTIHSQSMVPAAHLLWSGVWAGIAAGAMERARKYLRQAARLGGELPPGATHFTKALASLRALRALLAAMLARYESIQDDPKALATVDFQTAIHLLKVEASELAVETVLSAMRVTGLAGYRNDRAASIGRSLRDILSAPIMINNDRILANLTGSSLLSDIPLSVRD